MKLTAHRGASITRTEVINHLRRRHNVIDVDYPVKLFIQEVIGWLKRQVKRNKSRRGGL